MQELLIFGIRSERDLHSLLERHFDKILQIDASPMDEWHQKYYSCELGEEVVDERSSKGFWFAFPALLRLALELEFGGKYEEFVKKRDGV